MNNIITLPKLVDLLSRASSKDKALCENFVKAFTSGVAESLAAGEVVKLKGFGQFRLVVTDGVRRVAFIPDKETSEAINAPFACFEPVELAPDVSEEMLAAVDDIDETEDDEATSEVTDTSIDDSVLPDTNQATSGDEEVVAESLIFETIETESESIVQEEADSEAEHFSEEEIESEPASTSEEESESDPASTSEEESESDPASTTEEETESDPESTSEEDIEPEPESASEEVTDSDSKAKPQAMVFYDEAQNAGEKDCDLDSVDDSFQSQAECQVAEPLEDGVESEPINESYAPEEDDSVKSRGISWFWVAVAYIGGMAIGFSIGFFGHGYITGLSDKHPIIDLTGITGSNDAVDGVLDFREAENIILTDSTMESTFDQPVDTLNVDSNSNSTFTMDVSSPAEPASQKPEDPIYDTVTANRYLTKMAVEHYGNKVFWVYIYLENQKKIKDPNNVQVGTRLLIPPREKYDVSSTNENANIEAAKRKQTEIFNKLNIR